MEESDQSYISYKDHCSFVAEFKRLFDDLKCKYERSQERMTSHIEQLETTLRGVATQRDSWKKKSRKLAIEVQDKEKQLETTLECLRELAEEHGRNTERRNLSLKKKKLKADWMNGWRSHRRKIDRVQRRLYQRQEILARQKQSATRLRIRLSRTKARLRSLRLQLDSQQQENDLLTRKNQRLKSKLKLFRQVFFKNDVLLLEHDDHLKYYS